MRRSSRRITVGYATAAPETPPDYPEYAALRAAAQRSFTDPRWQALLNEAVQARGGDWCSAVLGREWGAGRDSATDVSMLLLAHEHDVVPPIPQFILDARAEREAREAVARAEREGRERAEAERQAKIDAEWKALAEALPVPVVVAHNYRSRRHYENYVQGVDHIVVLAELHHGRLSRRATQALCESPSNAHNLYFPNLDIERNRRPECKSCIRTACRITGLAALTLMSRR